MQSLNPLPFVMAMANCVAWTSYSFLIEDWFLIIPNSLGCMIATLLFLVSFGLGVPERRSRDTLTLAFMVLVVLLFSVAIVERMAVTSLEVKKQLWGYTGVHPTYTPLKGDHSLCTLVLYILPTSLNLLYLPRR